MQRTYTTQLKEKAGEKAQLQGWVHFVRRQGRIAFIVLRDIEGMAQVVCTRDTDGVMEAIDALTLESVIRVSGVIKEEKQAPGGFEMLAESIEILSHAQPELPIPVAEKGAEEADQQSRLDWRWIDLRKPEKALIFKVWTLVEHAFREYWTRNGYMEIHSPKIISTPSESGAEVFEVKYFDRKAYLAQSPQFYKQMAMAAGFEKVFEIGPVFRAEPSFTSRHATEYTSYDMEMSFIESHQDVIAEEERALVHVLESVREKYGDAIRAAYGRELTVPTLPFPQVTVAEAKRILKARGIASEKDGDLSPEEERELSARVLETQGHEFVFVTEYPADGRAFYHMRKEDDARLTKGFDLLWNGLEITTGAQREHRYDVLMRQAEERGMRIEAIQFYLDFFKYGCPPHGGFGFGSERMIMKIFDLPNVREAMYIYRGVKRLTP